MGAALAGFLATAFAGRFAAFPGTDFFLAALARMILAMIRVY
jgi:hypothetical protein